LDYKIHAIVNNAGICKDVPWNGRPKPEFAKETFDINYYGTVKLTETLKDKMVKPGGKILTVSSYGAVDHVKKYDDNIRK